MARRGGDKQSGVGAIGTIHARMKSRSRLRRVEARLAPPPRFVITGTGRSGSTYIARLLTEAGVKCHHERVFSRAGYRPCFDVRGESSWFAAPCLAEYEGIVLHQVREPLATVASLASRPMWGFGVVGQNIEVTGDPLLDAVRFYVHWNQLCEARADYRYRLEDIDTEIVNVCAFVAPDRVDAAVSVASSLSRRVNARPLSYEVSGFDDLPEGRDTEALCVQAERYGYETS